MDFKKANNPKILKSSQVTKDFEDCKDRKIFQGMNPAEVINESFSGKNQNFREEA